MNILVTYVSNTGNTKKIADAIYEVLPEEKEIAALSDVEGLDGYDLVFFGFPIMAFGPNPAAKEYLEKNAPGSRLALFITHGAQEDHEDVEVWKEKCLEAAAGAEIVGFFNSQGEVDPNVVEFLLKSENPVLVEFGRLAPSTAGQPDASKIDGAKLFARQVLEKYHGTKATGCA
jgi:flavodoxin